MKYILCKNHSINIELVKQINIKKESNNFFSLFFDGEKISTFSKEKIINTIKNFESSKDSLENWYSENLSTRLRLAKILVLNEEGIISLEINNTKEDIYDFVDKFIDNHSFIISPLFNSFNDFININSFIENLIIGNFLISVGYKATDKYSLKATLN